MVSSVGCFIYTEIVLGNAYGDNCTESIIGMDKYAAVTALT